MKNYYEILNVSRNATTDIIKKSYKKSAIIWHPDKHMTDKKIAEDKFREICEAYEVLSDVKLREEYDKKIFHIETNRNGNIKISDIINDLFVYNTRKRNKIVDVQVVLELSLDEIYTGIKNKNLSINRMSKCVECKGKGIKPIMSSTNINCGFCKGTGIIIKMNNFKMYDSCNLCKGTGFNSNVTLCGTCSGHKFLVENINISLDVPKGICHNKIIIMRNKGNIIPNDSEFESRSDVEITIKEKKHKSFLRDRDHYTLLFKLKISLAESLCGFDKTINFLNNEKFNVNNKNIVKKSNMFIVFNKGMPRFNTNKYGNLYITIEIIYPTELNIETKKKIWNLLTDSEFIEEKKDESIEIVDFDHYN